MLHLVTMNGFGNQIWQYLSIRNLAESLGLKMEWLGHLKNYDPHATSDKNVLSDMFGELYYPDGQIIRSNPLILNCHYINRNNLIFSSVENLLHDLCHQIGKVENMCSWSRKKIFKLIIIC